MRPPDILRQVVPTAVLALSLAVTSCGAKPETVAAQGAVPPNPTPISGSASPLPADNALAYSPAAQPNSINHSMLADITAVLSETKPITDTVVPIALVAPQDRVVEYSARVATTGTNIRSTPSVGATNVITGAVEGSTFAVDPNRKTTSGSGFTWIPVIIRVDGQEDIAGWITTKYSSSSTMTETVAAPLPSSSVSIDALFAPFAQIGGGSESGYPPAVQVLLTDIQNQADQNTILVDFTRAVNAEPDGGVQMSRALGIPQEYHTVNIDPLMNDVTISGGMGFPVGITIPKGSQLTGYGAIAVGQDSLFMFNVNPPQDPTSDVLLDQYGVQLTRDQLNAMFGQVVAADVITNLTTITGANLLDEVLANGVGVVSGPDGTQTAVPPLTQGDIGVDLGASVVYSQEVGGFFAMVKESSTNQQISKYRFNPVLGRWELINIVQNDAPITAQAPAVAAEDVPVLSVLESGVFSTITDVELDTYINNYGYNIGIGGKVTPPPIINMHDIGASVDQAIGKQIGPNLGLMYSNPEVIGMGGEPYLRAVYQGVDLGTISQQIEGVPGVNFYFVVLGFDIGGRRLQIPFGLGRGPVDNIALSRIDATLPNSHIINEPLPNATNLTPSETMAQIFQQNVGKIVVGRFGTPANPNTVSTTGDLTILKLNNQEQNDAKASGIQVDSRSVNGLDVVKSREAYFNSLIVSLYEASLSNDTVEAQKIADEIESEFGLSSLTTTDEATTYYEALQHPWLQWTAMDPSTPSALVR
ncbi:MAG: hypothetical protein NUV65_00290 [Candidatus Roizmanbacteria bacterium]|nr:hypothetical protein [Candidatus Roizmanbacteria bacterium]